MADPYALLAATDERASSAFDAINRNAIAAFNAESEAAKFGFQANLQTAQFREMQVQNSFERDLATQKMNLEEKRLNQSMSLAKLTAARQLASEDRDFNYRIAGEARQNLTAQLDALGTEEAQWRAASLSGDASAGQKITEIQEKKRLINGQMSDVFNRIKQEIDSGNTLNIAKSLRDVDAILEGREPERAPTPDSPLQSIGGFYVEDEDLPPVEGYGVLPPRPDGAKPNTLTGSAPITTEPLANSLINGATAQNTATARDLFPAALNSATQKAVSFYKKWLGGQVPDATKEPAKVTTEIGSVLSRNPISTPEGGVTKIGQRESDHFRSLISTDFSSVPESLRPSLLQGKRRAYNSLLQAGDPVVRSQYETLYRLGTSPDITQADANGQLEDAVKEGMISDHTRREWLLQKSGNIERKNKTADPFKQERDNLSATLDLLSKAKALRSEGSVTNPQSSVDLGDDFFDSLTSSAQSTLARMQIGMKERNLMDRIDQARSNPIGASPDQIAAMEIELQETNFSKGRQIALERIPELNNQMSVRGILSTGESALALAKEGEQNFVDVISGRLRSRGLDEASARSAAAVYYKQYAAMSQFLPEERSSDGSILTAPKPIQIQVGPSSAATNAVADTTFMGVMRDAFSGARPNPVADASARTSLTDRLVRDFGESSEDVRREVRLWSDMTVREGGERTDVGIAAEFLRTYIDSWSEAPAGEGSDLQRIDRQTRNTATKVADARTESVFAKGRPNQAEVDSLKNDIEAFGIVGRFDLNDRTGYHNAMKRVVARKLLNSLYPNNR